MGYTFRKYLSNRGSALLMVLSTMTALMVCCMAMYFSVISSRSTQYAIFNRQQAYQSATSLSDALIASMNTHKGGFESIGDKLSKMEVGEELTTSSNGYKAFSADGTGKDEESQVGAYMMTIKRLPDETLADGTEVKVFDIAVTSSVNGTKQVFHNIIQFEDSPGKRRTNRTEVFTATGYVPNDVFLDAGIMYLDVFFDNPHTYLKGVGGTNNVNLYGNISCGGSLYMESTIIAPLDRPVTYAIRGDYDNNCEGDVALKSGSKVMIGGNCRGKNFFSGADVYIAGDLIVDSALSTNSRYFVAGDVILNCGGWVNLGKVYCNGSVDESQMTGASEWDHGVNTPLAGTWDGAEIDGVMTYNEMITALDEKTSTNAYYKWKIDEEAVKTVKKLEYVTDLNSTNPLSYTKYLAYGEDGKGCTIEDITVEYNNEARNSLTLVIDTGDDPDNVYSVRIKGNRNYIPGGDPENPNETFSWYPKNISDNVFKGFTRPSQYALHSTGGPAFQVLVMGRGSVLFDVPEGVIYQDDDYMTVMHYGWYVLNSANTETFLGGSKDGLSKREIIENTHFSHADGVDSYVKYVHTECHAGDGCNYTESNSTDECSVCGAKLVEVKCDEHELVDTYCKTCDPNRGKKANCAHRVDRSEVDKYLASNADAKKRMKGKDGKVIYPNVNIFVISCDENANIRFATAAAEDTTTAPTAFINNCFMGYIYAPYMTFKAVAPKSSGSGRIRLAGGMTVSDYIIYDSYTMIAIYPDKLPDELGASSAGTPLESQDSKSWKINLVAH